MEAEVDQNAIDLRSGEIERKNLLITNENLIAKCIGQDVFYTVTNSALTASQFHELSIAYNVAQTCAVKLEDENLNLLKKFKMMIMITWTSKDAPKFDEFFELNKKDAHHQTYQNTICKLKAQISQLKANKSDENDCFQAENSKIKQHYTELYDLIKIMRATYIEKITSLLNEIKTLKTQELLENVIASCPKTVKKRDRQNASTHAKINKHVTFTEPLETSPNNTSTQVKQLNEPETNVLAIPSIKVNSVTKANRSPPRSNTKIDRTLTSKSGYKKNVKAHLRNNKSNLHKKNRVDSGIRFKHACVNSNSNSHCKTCDKCMILFNRDECVAKVVITLEDPISHSFQQVVSELVPANTTDTRGGDKSGRMLTLTAEDMQRKKNDVKARTTLLLSLPDEHQLRFSKYKTARELWAAILKTFGGNEATKRTKKNLLKSDLDTMSLDDLYNHLKVYESKVQKKPEQNFQNMAFISSVKHSNRNEDGNTASVPTANTNVPTSSASVATISQDTACAYIASQSSGSQINFEDINQIDEDGMKEMDIKWNMALLSMRADKFWKKTGKKISIQGSDVAGFDELKDRGRKDNFRQGSKAEEQYPKALMAIDRVGWDWSYMANDEEDHALVADEVAPTEFALMANTSAESKKLETLQQEKEGVDGKLAGLLTASKDLDNLIKSQRPSPTAESISEDDQNRNTFVSETVASPITSKPFIKFVRPKDSQSDSKTDKKETPKKPPVKYTKHYRKLNMKPKARGNQRNWNNLKSQQLGPDFIMKKKACFYCGNFNHLANDYRKKVKQNFTPRPFAHKPYRLSQRPVKTHMNDARPNRTFFNKQAHSYTNRPIHRTSAVRSPSRAPWVPTVNRNYSPVNKEFSTGSRNFPTTNRKFPTASRKFPTGSTKSITADMGLKGKVVNPSACWFWRPSQNLSNKGPKNNSVSVMFKKYTYIDTQECIVLGRDFKLLDDANILLRTPRRLGHLNFKTMNKLVRYNLVRGLPTKCFENDHTCTACLKGKQHKASCKSKLVNSVSKPLHNLHMDLFGPTSVSTICNTPKLGRSRILGPGRVTS
nr:hypothetical protein [Tanacetum cinerariifolium]